jgi:hypothetical protein
MQASQYDIIENQLSDLDAIMNTELNIMTESLDAALNALRQSEAKHTQRYVSELMCWKLALLSNAPDLRIKLGSRLSSEVIRLNPHVPMLVRGPYVRFVATVMRDRFNQVMIGQRTERKSWRTPFIVSVATVMGVVCLFGMHFSSLSKIMHQAQGFLSRV